MTKLTLIIEKLSIQYVWVQYYKGDFTDTARETLYLFNFISELSKIQCYTGVQMLWNGQITF